MSKTILSILFVLSISNAGSIPNWYLSLKANKSNSEIIGYGEAKTLEEAKVKARENIAKQIKTTIESTAIHNISSNNDNLHNLYSKKIQEKTVATLQDIKLLKNYDNEEGRVFVALSYENIPFINRMAKKLDLSKCKEKQNSYMKKTLLLTKINKQTNCTPHIKLQRKNNLWYLVHKNSIQELPSEFFEELYTSVENENINLKPSKKILKDGDEFYFTATPKQSGYLSLLTVYENGTVTVLIPNIQVKKNKIIQLPDENYGEALEAGLVKLNQPTHDLYVAIYSQKKLNLSRFEQAAQELSKVENSKKFDELINKLDGYSFSTILLRTKP